MVNCSVRANQVLGVRGWLSFHRHLRTTFLPSVSPGHHHLLLPDQSRALAQTGRLAPGCMLLPTPALPHTIALVSKIQWLSVDFKNMQVLLNGEVSVRCWE